MPQSTKLFQDSALTSKLDETSPKKNSFNLAALSSKSAMSMSEGDSMTPQQDATQHIRHNHGFNEST